MKKAAIIFLCLFSAYLQGQSLWGGYLFSIKSEDGDTLSKTNLQAIKTFIAGSKGTNSDMLAISSPPEGLEFWNTTIKGKCVFDGTDWQRLSCSQTPTVTVGTGAGTGASASVVGNDLGGVISITAGTSPATNATVVTLDFHTDFDQVPKSVSLTAADKNTIAFISTNSRAWYVDSTAITVDEFQIKSDATNTPTDGVTYKFFYKVSQ